MKLTGVYRGAQETRGEQIKCKNWHKCGNDLGKKEKTHSIYKCQWTLQDLSHIFTICFSIFTSWWITFYGTLNFTAMVFIYITLWVGLKAWYLGWCLHLAPLIDTWILLRHPHSLHNSEKGCMKNFPVDGFVPSGGSLTPPPEANQTVGV